MIKKIKVGKQVLVVVDVAVVCSTSATTRMGPASIADWQGHVTRFCVLVAMQ